MFTQATVTLFLVALVIALIIALLFPFLGRGEPNDKSIVLPIFGLLSISFGALAVIVIVRTAVELWTNYQVGQWFP